jgi:hypothetical protein
MLIAVDLETIASRTNSPGLAWTLNDAFDLCIPEKHLEQLTTLEELEKTPAARALFEQAEKDVALSRRLEAVIEAVWNDQQNAQLQRTALPIRYAATSLSLLAQKQKLLYVTWRMPEGQAVTSEWLLFHGFPCSEHLAICQEPAEPFQAALNAVSPGETILLISAECEAMIEAFLFLPQRQRERVFLAAFRRRDTFGVDDDPPFSVFSLPSWLKEHVFGLLAEIDGYQELQRLLRIG